MAGGRDEVEQDVDAVVPKTRVTLDTGLLSKNVIVLPLEVSDNLAKAVSRSVGEPWRARAELTWPRCRSGRRIQGYPQW